MTARPNWCSSSLPPRGCSQTRSNLRETSAPKLPAGCVRERNMDLDVFGLPECDPAVRCAVRAFRIQRQSKTGRGDAANWKLRPSLPISEQIRSRAPSGSANHAALRSALQQCESFMENACFECQVTSQGGIEGFGFFQCCDRSPGLFVVQVAATVAPARAHADLW